jgi:IS5 family transposase
MINKVALTKANVTDAQGMQHVCPSQGAIYADKGYCVKSARNAAKKNGCHLAAIKKNNMKDKNYDLDKWISGIRVRYRGLVKNLFSAFMQAIVFNTKRRITLEYSVP